MKKVVILLIFCTAFSFGCRKTPDTSKLSANFVVQTARDPDADFGSYQTYYISDTISLETTNPDDSIWFDASAKQLVDAVKANMSAMGYTFVSKGAQPDLGLVLGVVKDLNLGVIYPGWWYGYWGYWGGCYWGYCGYPPYYPWYGMIYTIPTGTLILDMLDLKNATTEGKLGVRWGSVMSGGLGLTGNDLALGISAIDQAFAQSPYLQTN